MHLGLSWDMLSIRHMIHFQLLNHFNNGIVTNESKLPSALISNSIIILPFSNEIIRYQTAHIHIRVLSDESLIGDCDNNCISCHHYHQERNMTHKLLLHDDVINWKHFPRYWPFVREIHLSPVNSPHKGRWRRALMFSLLCAWINRWINNRDAGDLRRHQAHYDVIVMEGLTTKLFQWMS